MSIKDAKPGERWEYEHQDKTVTRGLIVEHYDGGTWIVSRSPSGLMEAFDIGFASHTGWKKVANADGTPYEEPKPLPDFGVCWAARDEDGEVRISSKEEKPKKNGNWWGITEVNLGKITFRPELPWDKTACKVRVRLEVVE